MIEQRVFEYLANSLWQVPLLVGAIWLVVRIARPGLLAQHSLWLAALMLAVLTPLRGIGGVDRPDLRPLASVVNASEIPPSLPSQAWIQPIRRPSPLRLRTLRLEPRTIDWLIGLYGVSIAFGLARLMHGWLATKRLVAAAVAHPLTTLESALVRACSRQIDLAESRLPEVRFSTEDILGPMVAGLHPPVLLVPMSLRPISDHGFDDKALTAVLLHELMHVRRRDYLANLLSRALAIPIGYHPATQVLHRRIRQTREMICDAAAAGAFPSNASYARSLLSLAEGIVSEPHNLEAVGLFDSNCNSLEERIMKLTEARLPVSVKIRTARIAAGTLVLVATAAIVTTLHLKSSTPIVYAMQTAQSTPAPATVPAVAAEPRVPTPNPKPAVRQKPSPAVQAESQDSRDRAEQQAADARNQAENLKLQLKIDPIVIPKFDFKGFDSSEFEKSMADMKLHFDSPEFKTQMAKMNEQMNSPEFKKQIEDATRNANLANSADFKRQMEEFNRQFNSPEFKQQIELSKKLAIEAQADAGRRTAEMRKQLAEASAAIASAKAQVQDEKVRKQLDEAQRRIQEATKP